MHRYCMLHIYDVLLHFIMFCFLNHFNRNSCSRHYQRNVWPNYFENTNIGNIPIMLRCLSTIVHNSFAHIERSDLNLLLVEIVWHGRLMVIQPTMPVFLNLYPTTFLEWSGCFPSILLGCRIISHMPCSNRKWHYGIVIWAPRRSKPATTGLQASIKTNPQSSESLAFCEGNPQWQDCVLLDRRIVWW